MESLEKIRENLSGLETKLIEMCSSLCSNQISSDIKYIFQDAMPDIEELNNRIYRNYIDRKFFSREQVADHVYNLQKSIQWVDFQFFCSSEKETVIAAVLVYAPASDGEHALNYHAGVRLPPWIKKQDEKFDANWQIKSRENSALKSSWTDRIKRFAGYFSIKKKQ